ncbi:uncharacterized protein A4U43_C06F4220 [Asparagus officinalis]|uniref:Uncharacterized protein n=1 Tax=Asparagus officinalis TaxID=4686 RepID=A0A5P1ELN7_ASPOF|nr:uncharacterized protein A4U43_C06F4220 [Asparagus officinalis]
MPLATSSYKSKLSRMMEQSEICTSPVRLRQSGRPRSNCPVKELLPVLDPVKQNSWFQVSRAAATTTTEGNIALEGRLKSSIEVASAGREGRQAGRTSGAVAVVDRGLRSSAVDEPRKATRARVMLVWSLTAPNTFLSLGAIVAGVRYVIVLSLSKTKSLALLKLDDC